MSKCCCKYAKWFPHNWLCLKGLYVFFLTLFYIMLAFMIFQDIQILRYPALTGRAMWLTLLSSTISNLAAAIGILTLAKILKALRKIEHAVAPCCCQHQEDPAKTEETK